MENVLSQQKPSSKSKNQSLLIEGIAKGKLRATIFGSD